MLMLAYKVGGWGKKRPKICYVTFEWSISNFEFGFRNTWAPLCVLVLHPVQWILLTTYHVFARKTKCTFLLVILHFIMTMGPFFVFLQKHQNIGLNRSLIGHAYFLSIWFSIVQIKNTCKENSTKVVTLFLAI